MCVEPDRGKSQHHDIGSPGSKCGMHALYQGKQEAFRRAPTFGERVSVPCQYTAWRGFFYFIIDCQKRIKII